MEVDICSPTPCVDLYDAHDSSSSSSSLVCVRILLSSQRGLANDSCYCYGLRIGGTGRLTTPFAYFCVCLESATVVRYCCWVNGASKTSRTQRLCPFSSRIVSWEHSTPLLRVRATTGPLDDQRLLLPQPRIARKSGAGKFKNQKYGETIFFPLGVQGTISGARSYADLSTAQETVTNRVQNEAGNAAPRYLMGPIPGVPTGTTSRFFRLKAVRCITHVHAAPFKTGSIDPADSPILISTTRGFQGVVPREAFCCKGLRFQLFHGVGFGLKLATSNYPSVDTNIVQGTRPTTLFGISGHK
eukprot:scaffold6007_cov183-Amphora_coffeaeformis.AAC.35